MFLEPPYTRLFAIPRVIARMPSLSGIHLGENIAAISRIGIAPSAKNQVGPETIIKWGFRLGNELSVTAMTNTGKIVYIEYDWGGDSRVSLTDFPNLQFGTTTLSQIREKFGSNGFTFDKKSDGAFS